MPGPLSIIDKPNTVSFSTVLLTNIIPFIGVLFWGWSFFSVLLVYWVETLFHSFFIALRIITAQLNPDQIRFFYLYKIWKSIKLILLRLGTLLFYLLFIVLFIGFQSTTSEDLLSSITNMFHGQRYMLWALLGFTVSNIIEYIFYYRLNDEHKNSTPDSQFIFVDARFVVIHCVIVLGFIASEFFTKEIKWVDNPGHVMVTVFVLIKLMADVIGNLIKNKTIKLQVQKN